MLLSMVFFVVSPPFSLHLKKGSEKTETLFKYVPFSIFCILVSGFLVQRRLAP